LRVPTGGGKTLMACHALGIAAKEYAHVDQALCLWLVPSNTIKDQTLAALRNREHPYRQAVESRFSGPVTVVDLTEALYVQRGTLAGETVIIVSTLQALRVEDTEGRKVYESAGALQHHFNGLSERLLDSLERREDGSIAYSLANVLRLNRPIVIMDEAHNARTPLSFDTLARLSPSCIIEFTATPEIEHSPDREIFASNILHHVSAAELKAEEMVKLPIKLRTHGEWKEVLGEAVRAREHLEKIACREEKLAGEYIRPIVLYQAQARSQTKETLTVDVVKKSLMEDFKIPEQHIAIATGDIREIDEVDLFSRECPIRHIITVAALKEGWDCSFAYVLCSVSNTATPRAVEQVLGRILRLPHARRKGNEELNCAYAFTASPRFLEAANSLKDALLECGFQRMESDQLVTYGGEEQGSLFDRGSLFGEVEEKTPERPDLSRLPEEVRERVKYNEGAGAIVFTGVMGEKDKKALEKCFNTQEGKEVVGVLYNRSHRRIFGDDAPCRQGKIFQVPVLAIRVDGQPELFEENHFMDFEWKLSDCDTALSDAEFSWQQEEGSAGEIDITKEGKIEVEFIERLHEQLHLLSEEKGWDVASLVNWLDRQIPHLDITRIESKIFIHRVITTLMEERKFHLEKLAARKFRLKNAIQGKIKSYRDAKSKESYNRLLFGPEADKAIEASPEFCFNFEEARYAPNWYYEGGYKLPKHFFPEIGELKSEGEEFECAVYLSQSKEVEYWVRNLERRADNSFWLQTSTDKFYPDFIAKLVDGRILVVEYKGEDRWSNDDSKEKRAVGELWADWNKGRCLFVMPKGKDWKAIDRVIGKKKVDVIAH
jgi:type III restriction enzyme